MGEQVLVNGMIINIILHGEFAKMEYVFTPLMRFHQVKLVLAIVMAIKLDGMNIVHREILYVQKKQERFLNRSVF